MNISDNWFTRSMLIDTISRANQVQEQTKTSQTSISDGESFLELLQELIASQQMDTGIMNNAFVSAHSETAIHTSVSNTAFEPEASLLNSEGGRTLGYQGSDIEQMDSLLGGKLAGMGAVFDQAGKKYNISSGLLAAIAQHETGNGVARAAIEKNNIAGMMGKNGLRSYASVEESIFDMARNLSQNYLDKGLTTIAEIGGKYAPVGASNDPAGLNNHWVKGVSKLVGHFRA